MKNIAYIDNRVRTDVIHKLEILGFEVIGIPENKLFDDAISGHADMNLFQINGKVFVSTNVRYLFSNSATIIEKEQGSKLSYPHDAFLNCIVVRNDLICNKKTVAPEILDFASKNNYNVINVNQGYTKCNIAVVSERNRAVITEDIGIYKTLYKKGYDVCLLKTHSVTLYPYDYGFIGGATGLFNNVLYFNGNIQTHPEAELIINFCSKHKVEVCSLCEGKLEDCGSIYFFNGEYT